MRSLQRDPLYLELVHFYMIIYVHLYLSIYISDVEEILGVSESYAYKLIRKLNKEMQNLGFQTIQGRIDTKFFYEHFYQTQNYERRDA